LDNQDFRQIGKEVFLILVKLTFVQNYLLEPERTSDISNLFNDLFIESSTLRGMIVMFISLEIELPHTVQLIFIHCETGSKCFRECWNIKDPLKTFAELQGHLFKSREFKSSGGLQYRVDLPDITLRATWSSGVVACICNLSN